MAHKCHGTTYFLTAQLTFSRHNLLSHGTTYFLATQLTFSRHNLLSARHSLLSDGTTYFFRGTIYFLTAKITFFLQILLFYWSPHNLLSHGGSKFSWRKFNGFLCQREVCRLVGYLQLMGPQSLGSIIVVSLCVLFIDLDTVGLSVMCAHYGHNLSISLCKN